eukprot:8395518-Alexandrium_andersonii.AAC.1
MYSCSSAQAMVGPVSGVELAGAGGAPRRTAVGPSSSLASPARSGLRAASPSGPAWVSATWPA